MSDRIADPSMGRQEQMGMATTTTTNTMTPPPPSSSSSSSPGGFWNSLHRWLGSLLYQLGLQNKSGSILCLGLDNAGKTTLIHRLKTDGGSRGAPNSSSSSSSNIAASKASLTTSRTTTTTTVPSSTTTSFIRAFPPTDRPSHHDHIHILGPNLHLQVWDLGGHEAVRHLWEDYVSTAVSAVLFLVDAADPNRLEETAFELDALMVGEPQLLHDIPVCLLLNKCDLPEAVSTEEICRRLDYDRLVEAHGADRLALFRISVLQGEGYQDALKWVARFL